MKLLKKLLLIGSIVLSMSQVVYAEEVQEIDTELLAQSSSVSYIANGQCGDEVFWALDASGNLVISGKGNMWKYKAENVHHTEADAPVLRDNPFLAYYDKIVSVSFAEGVTSVGEGAFYGNSYLRNVSFSNTMQTIDGFAFMNCENLSDFILPNSVIYLGQSCFTNTGISKIELNHDYSYVGIECFSHCKNLTDVKITKDAFFFQYAVGGLFRGCTKLEYINVEEGNLLFYSVDGVMYSKDDNGLQQYPCGRKGDTYTLADNCGGVCSFSALADCAYLKHIIIPSTVSPNFKSEFDMETGIPYDGLFHTQIDSFTNQSSLTIKIPDDGTGYYCMYDENYNTVTEIKPGQTVYTGILNRAKQTIKVKVSKKNYKYSTLKKGEKTFSIGAKADTKLTYKVTKYPKGGKKYISVSKKGVVKIKKGAKKGTYKIKVTADQSVKYLKSSKTITIKVK